MASGAPNADNTLLNPGAGGDLIRTVLDGGVKTQVVKIEQLVTESTGNNSTTNLAASGVFVGTAESTLSVGGIQFTFTADQFCTVVVEQDSLSSFTSGRFVSDSFNFDPVVGNIGLTVQAVTAYFRIRVTNTSTTTATTFLSLQTVLCPVIEVVPRALDARGRLKVASTDFGLDVQRGVYPNISYNNKFGRNAACAAGDAIWSISTAFVEPVTASVCNVVSTDNTKDIPGGTGARTILVTGINGSYDEVTETVTLNGTTNVPTVNSYWAISRSYVTTAGTDGTAAGTISITSTAAGTPAMGSLAVGFNQTQSAQYMVPRNYSAYLNLINIGAQNVSANSTLDLGMFKKDFGGVYRIQADWLITGGADAWQVTEHGYPLKWPAKSRILFKVNAIGGAGTWDVRVDYDIVLVADSAA